MNDDAGERQFKPETGSVSATHVVVEGTLKPDGSLELDSKLNLPPGRVQIIVQPLPDGASVYNPTSVPDLTTEQIETRRLAQPDAKRPRF